jgi:cysteine desulfurase
MIYLDNNATTPVDPEVSDAIFSSLKRDFGNPSSAHHFGMKAKEVIENSRMIIADFLGCRHDEIYFTSGGTESNNLSLIGTALFHKKGHIITSVIEHPSITNTCMNLKTLGFEVTYAPADKDGIVILDKIKQSIKKNTILISIMHSNNETGIIQPIEEIGKMAKEYGIPLHTDAAQTIGKMHFSLKDSLIEMTTIVSHKFYGPKGIGALYIKRGTALKNILFGANHERGLRPGTENVPGIVGFGKACSISKRDINLRVSHTTELRDLIIDSLKSHIPDVKINGHETKRLPNTLNISIPGIASYDLVEKIKDRVAVSTGSACHSGKQIPSSVLTNIGLTDKEALSSLRLSVGKDNTVEEINEAVEILANAVEELRKNKPSVKS